MKVTPPAGALTPDGHGARQQIDRVCARWARAPVASVLFQDRAPDATRARAALGLLAPLVVRLDRAVAANPDAARFAPLAADYHQLVSAILRLGASQTAHETSQSMRNVILTLYGQVHVAAQQLGVPACATQ